MQRLGVPLKLWGVALTLLLAAAVAWMVTAGGLAVPWRVGQTVPRAITARVDFQVEDERQTIERRVQARDASPNYYLLDVALVEEVRSRLINALTIARAHPEQPDQLRELAARNKVLLDQAAVGELQRLAGLQDASEFHRAVDACIRVLRAKPIVNVDNPGIRRPAATRAILLDPGRELVGAAEDPVPEADGPQERTHMMNRLIFTSDSEAVQRAVAEAAAVFREPLRSSMAASIIEILRIEEPADQPMLVRALCRFDTARTLEVAERAAEEVPVQYTKFARDDKLADAHALTAEDLGRLRSEQRAWLAHLRENDPSRLTIQTAARAVLAVLVVVGVVAYMASFQPRVLSNPLRRSISSLVLLALLGLSRLVFLTTEVPPHAVTGFQAFAAGLLAIVYAHGSVFAISGGLALLITLAVQQGSGFLLMLLATSGVLGVGLRVVRYRGRIVLVTAAAACAALGVSLVAGLLEAQPLAYALRQSLWAAATTLIAGFILEGVLPGIERLFRLSTGMTLLEWCDANKPLLRTMAAEAPGTYNHSMLVGSLAGAAADAIGANSLLARAGAYYHDIGKTNKPEYFVENQPPGVSRHDRLSPAMSVLVIIGHVKDGIEMAKEYNLPESLHPFIAEHHGTTLVEYFYHAATKQRKPGDPPVAETEFRYPGPKPQSRETAILLLCDAVEGAVRAMPEPTPNRIEQVVSDIVQKRLMDGQFDECDLTFRELAIIEKSLVKTLSGIYHARISYPDATDAQPDAERQPQRRVVSS